MREIVIVIPMSTKSCAATPSTKTIGRNIATLVSVEAVTAVPMSCAPSRVASRSGIPCSRSRVTFSMSTIALSPSIPMPRASPVREITFRLILRKYIATNVASMETGIVMPMITGYPG